VHNLKPITITHETYQNFVLEQLKTHYSAGILTLLNKDWPIIHKLWITDLSGVSNWLSDYYSLKGSMPRDPASMMRSYLLFLLTNPSIGITKWVDQLHRIPLYAILSGFEPGDIPGVGTFYDFFDRLWNSENNNTKSNFKHKRKKQKRKKPKKGEKAPLKKPGIVKRLVDRFFKYGSKKKAQPADRLFDFFQSQILEVSLSLGLLGNRDALSLAGDGTPIETARFPRSKSICDCREKGLNTCSHPRKYSQPDCNSGWDSSREKYFNGYHLYMLSACDSPYDLPIFPKLNPASRHDSISLLATLDEFHHRFKLSAIDRLLLDAAHDAESIYQLLNYNNVEPFIDLNPRTKNNLCSSCDIQISPKGIPVCPIGLEMKPNGFELSKNRRKWRCPLSKGTSNTCEKPCSKAKYGRTFHTFTLDNQRLFTKTPRNSEKWSLVYKRRTSVERSNKREKVDYLLETGRHRSTKMWYVRLYAIMICQHIDAWHSHREKEFVVFKDTFFL